MADFNLTKMAVNMYCPGNVVQQDDVGLPSVLVYVPAFKNSDVLDGGDDSIHPAFIVNGRQIPGFYYSKYQNVVHNGKAYSLPAEAPQTFETWDASRGCCESKGYGWHMSTAAEWAALALWCKKNGIMPKGNNNYGKHSTENDYKAIGAATSDTGETTKVATGTGPLTWSHDRTPSGIWDLHGNISEWQTGLRIVWGELQILANNDAADPDNPQNETSTIWKAINAADGSLVEPESKTTDTAAKTSGNTVKLDYVNGDWTYATGISNADSNFRGGFFYETTCSAEIGAATKAVLRSLALLPVENSSASDYGTNGVWISNGMPEVLFARGSYYASPANSGIFSLLGYLKRNNAHETIGFRASYIPNI